MKSVLLVLFLTSVLYGCPFCQEDILERQMVYRGELASIIATHKPVVSGHLLVIPNRHVETFDELSPEEFLEISQLIKKAHVSKEYLILQKNGVLAGQTVPHVHFHLLPRESNISIPGFIIRFLFSPLKKALSEEEMRAYISEQYATLGL